MTLTVKDVCERYGVQTHTVLAWIRSGELKALNVGVRPGKKKPRWRITEAALSAFEQLRTPSPPSAPVRRSRKRDDGVVKFYKE